VQTHNYYVLPAPGANILFAVRRPRMARARVTASARSLIIGMRFTISVVIWMGYPVNIVAIGALIHTHVRPILVLEITTSAMKPASRTWTNAMMIASAAQGFAIQLRAHLHVELHRRFADAQIPIAMPMNVARPLRIHV
jgi:hypothetical protein